MGFLHQISSSSTSIRTANSQDVGVKGSFVVSFKIGPCSFIHKFIVCEGITRPFILGEEFLSHHYFKLGWTDDNKRFAEYRSKVITVASQAVMDDRIMVSHAVRISARHFAMVPTKCPNMFLGRGGSMSPAQNLKINFQIYIWNPCNITTLTVSGKRRFLT